MTLHSSKTTVSKAIDVVTIDASGKVLGRLATEVALLLRGKHKPDFAPYKEGGEIISVYNLEHLKITGKKLDDKLYWHYSGYPGGIKPTSLRTLFERDPGEVFYRAVFGMLPKNKLRARMLKRLKLFRGALQE